MKRGLLALAVAAVAATAWAQSELTLRYGNARGPAIRPNVEYTGQFTFVRLRYGPPVPYQSQRIPWSHDYPFGEQHFMQIMNEVTNLKPRVMESNVMGLDDPDLPRFPVAYMSEPGYMFLTDAEVTGFRTYLQKGGFVIFDDFAEERGGWAAFESQMARVIPGGKWFELDGTHPIFHAFFEIPEPLKFLPPYEEQAPPVYYGLFEDNDQGKRLMAIVNFNNDISEYWEYSGQGFAPVPVENEAYKLGVNYVIYGLTH
ncbi:MAG: DUF4159 domain-containing protein [Vicinamibacterales bacterium]